MIESTAPIIDEPVVIEPAAVEPPVVVSPSDISDSAIVPDNAALVAPAEIPNTDAIAPTAPVAPEGSSTRGATSPDTSSLFAEPAAGNAKPIMEDKPVMEDKPIMEDKPAMEDKPVMEDKPETPAEASSSVDDLFGTTEPAENKAMEDKPSAVDDLFGNSSEPAAADAQPPAETTPPATDDLFGNPPAEPAQDRSDNSLDNLFGDPPPATTEPKQDNSLDDLFGNPPEEKKAPAGESLDDLFGTEPKNEPQKPATESLDDLFGMVHELPAPRQPQTPRPQPTQIKPAKATASVLVSTKALQNSKMRTWVDNTGLFHTRARLIQVNDAGIQLQKDNGKICRVPNGRLCLADRAYVEAVKAKNASTNRLAMLIGN